MNLDDRSSVIDVSIVIVAYKNAAILKLCLDSLSKNLGDEISSEVIVVENDAHEEIRDLVMEFDGNKTYIPFDKNVGFACALNAGMRRAKGKAVLALNPDIVITKGAVERLYRYVIDHPSAGIVGPMLLNFNGSRQPSCFKFYTPATIIYRRTLLGKTFFGKKSLQDFIIKTQDDHPENITGWLMGSALMIRSDNLERIGLMDERYFMYFEDVDWCRRFYEAGLKVVYFPESKMFHYHGKQSATKNIISVFSNRITLVHLLSGFKYFVKFRGWRVG